MPSYPPGTIATITSDLSRYSDFWTSLEAMYRPPGTKDLHMKGLWTANTINRCIAKMAPESQWIQLWSDDHRFKSDCLMRLLAHDVDIVAPFCLLRSPPFRPSTFHEVEPEAYQFYTWEELHHQQGLLPIQTCGGPGAVIRREVLDTVGAPWFTGLAGEHPQEDLSTFARWRQQGFQLYVDLDTPIEHLTTMSVAPHRLEDGTWTIRIWCNVDLCLLPTYDGLPGIMRESESK
jgi:hypothetical protein